MVGRAWLRHGKEGWGWKERRESEEGHIVCLWGGTLKHADSLSLGDRGGRKREQREVGEDTQRGRGPLLGHTADQPPSHLRAPSSLPSTSP